MRNSVIENTDRFTVSTSGSGSSVTVTDKSLGIDAFMQGDDAGIYLRDLDDMRAAHEAEEGVWSKESWDSCLAQISDDYLASQNPEYASWREAAMAYGWSCSVNGGADPASITNNGLDRTFPIGKWEDAVRSLGYSSPEDAIRDLESPSP